MGNVTPAQLCQGFFILASAGVLAVAAMPNNIRRLLTEYGARSSIKVSDASMSTAYNPDFLISLATRATSLGRIPHRWFIHFYITSVACSVFWAYQYLFDGAVLRHVTARQRAGDMTLGQVWISWLLMLLQGMRRLYEDVYITKPSKSTMWMIHWALALAFYSAMSVAVWVEGSGAILTRPQNLTIPLRKTLLAILLYFAGWLMQHECHRHLSSLKKYSLPTDGLFRILVCPHYTCECMIYLSIAVAAAPPGQVCNRTLLCALLFVTTNLGTTANGTAKFYAEKFGVDKVPRWKMIPWLF